MKKYNLRDAMLASRQMCTFTSHTYTQLIRLPVLGYLLICNANFAFAFHFMITANQYVYWRLYFDILFFPLEQGKKLRTWRDVDADSHYAPVWHIYHNATRLLAFFRIEFCDAVMQPNPYLSVKSRVMFCCGSFKIKQSPSDYRALIYCEKCELWWTTED